VGQLTVGADGRVEAGGELFGVVSTDGRFVDADGDLLASLDGALLRGPEGAILGEVDDLGSVTRPGATILSFAADGAATGEAVAELEQAIRFRGPADARPIAALVLVGIADGIGFFKAAGRALGNDLDTEARRLCDALAAGDAAGLRAVMIGHEQLAAITRKAPSRADYDAMLAEWIDARVAEIAGAGKPASCARAEILERERLEADDRLLQAIDIAVARPVLAFDGAEHPMAFPIVFIEVDGAWKASIKK
jgi:hypothetical protein